MAMTAAGASAQAGDMKVERMQATQQVAVTSQQIQSRQVAKCPGEKKVVPVKVKGYTAINDVTTTKATKTVKVVENGQVYIIAGDKKYNMQGVEVK